MVEAHLRHPLRILSYCVLSNHWHFLVWPEEDGQLTAFFRKLARTRCAGAFRTEPWGTGTSIKDGSRASQFRATTTCCRCCAMSTYSTQ